jgi:DNA repair photolyase
MTQVTLRAGKNIATNVIYTPQGKAGEYAKLALNLFTGCPHRCTYCFAPTFLKVDREIFHSEVELRADLFKNLEKDVNKLRRVVHDPIHLCFVCDPYPVGRPDLWEHTNQVLRMLKEAGMSWQILTKSGMTPTRDFSLYSPGCSIGQTITFVDHNKSLEFEPQASSPAERMDCLIRAYVSGIITWVSLEPVIDPQVALQAIRMTHNYVDLYKVGTWNYDKRAKLINWPQFHADVVDLLEKYGKKYIIKKDLLRAAGIA